MNQKQLKELIKKEYRSIEMTPDVNRLQEELMFVHQNEAVVKKKKKLSLKPLIQLSFVCLCILCFNILPIQSSCNVSLDVNPSIELKVNNKEKVTKVYCHNQEAEELIGEMKLEKTDVNVALNAILGRMVGEGYITKEKNAILISVDGNDEKQRKEMKEKLEDKVKDVLATYNVDSDILSYEFKSTKDIQKLAAQYNISVGKAQIIQEIIDEDPAFQFQDLAKLPIKYINMLIHYRDQDFSSITEDGIDYRSGYVNQNDVKQLLSKELSINKKDMKNYKINLISKNDRLIYRVKFKYKGKNYEYHVHAISGNIKSTH